MVGISEGVTVVSLSTAQQQLLTKSASPDSVVAWDDFARADGALGTSPSGQSWFVTGGSIPVISGGKMVCPAADVTGYAQLDVGTTPKEYWMEFVIAPGVAAPTITLICSSDPSVQLANMVHLVTSDVNWALQKRAGGGSFDFIGGGSYGSQLLADGATRYRLGVILDGSTAGLSLPDGSYASCTDSSIATLTGPRIIFEPTWSSGGKQPKITRIGIVKRDTSLPPSPFPLRSEISSFLAPLPSRFEPRHLVTIVPTTAGWYRVINNSGYGCGGVLRIVAPLDANSQSVDIEVAFSISPFGQGSGVAQRWAAGVNLGQVSQVRVSSNGSTNQYVDLNVSASNLPIQVYFLGGSLPTLIANPVVGAAAGSANVKTLAFSSDW